MIVKSVTQHHKYTTACKNLEKKSLSNTWAVSDKMLLSSQHVAFPLEAKWYRMSGWTGS